MRDVCDGAALLTVVNYYCPDLMKLEGMQSLRAWTLTHSRTHIHPLNLNYQLTSKDISCKEHHALNLISMCETIFVTCTWLTVPVQSV